MTGQSGTPRTDAFEEAHTQYENAVFIGYQAEFCRQLERELAEAQARVLEVEQRCGDALLAKVEADDAR